MSEITTQYFLSNLFPADNTRTFRESSMCFQRPCGAGFSILSYSPDGTINACDTAREMGFLDLGDVVKDKYPAVRERVSSLLNFAPDSIPVCNSCAFMPYCGVCLVDVRQRSDVFPPSFAGSFACQWQKMALRYLFGKFLENGKDALILKTWGEYC